MPREDKRVLKVGSWLYDGQVAAHVQICSSYYGLSDSEDEDPNSDYPPGWPPRDSEGNVFYAEYSLPGGGSSRSTFYASAEEAVQEALKAILSPIMWKV
jgi:hypothetical protein